ncbi:MAG: carboxymuconolactone decarboxylase family protein, partial [Anaerolineae bacterium]
KLKEPEKEAIMARLPLVDNPSPEVAAIYNAAFPELSAFANQIKTLAHHPTIARNLVRLYQGFGQDSLVERRLIELAILTVSHLNRCRYCITHHAPLGARSGLSQAQLEALAADEWESSACFDEEEKLVIAYAAQITQDARRVPDALFERLRARFNEAQIVELTVRIALCNFFNRFNDVLQLDIEPEALATYQGLASGSL